MECVNGGYQQSPSGTPTTPKWYCAHSSPLEAIVEMTVGS